MESNKPIISIIIPIYNEEDNLDILYREIRESVDRLGLTYEIIFVDDGSSDGSLEHLKALRQREQSEREDLIHSRIIHFSRNFGQTAAMQAGFDYARGEIILSMDGDLQNDPKDIPKFLDKLDEGYDVVCGWREDRKDKTLTRIIPSKVANWLIGKVTGVPIHDNGCSLKAYKSHVIKSVKLYSDMHRFIPAATSMKGARIVEIVVNHRPRKYGQTKYGLSRIWKVTFDMITLKMLTQFHNRPIRWFAGFAMVFLVCGVIIGTASIMLFIEGGKNIVLPVASFLFFFLFSNLLFWGLLAEFFVKIESKKHKKINSFH